MGLSYSGENYGMASDQNYSRVLWFHHIGRALLRSGELNQLVDEHRLAGFTTEPALLEREIGEGTAYDDAIRESPAVDPHPIFEGLLIEDVRAAADVLRPVYEESGRAAGYISFDLPPLDTPQAKLREAKRLFAAIDRPNVMVKIPGKLTDLTAIEEALFAGVNVHVTMVYSVQTYVSNAQNYITALERRLYAGLPVDQVASIISFGLALVDGMVDRHLENNIRAAQNRADTMRVTANNELLGKVGIANARVAHRRFCDLFNGERFAALRAAGGHPQRILWADLQPHSPIQPPLMYLDGLAPTANDTLFMVNRPLLQRLQERSEKEPAASAGADDSTEILSRLDHIGVDLDRIGRLLQGDQEDLFAEAYNKLIARVDGKRGVLVSGFMQRQKMVLGIYRRAVEAELQRLRGQKSISRSWARDTALWTDDPDHAQIIANRLGWMSIATDGRIDRERLRALRDEAQRERWEHVVLLGMGGSSLAAEVMYRTFGRQAGYPALIVLDSTDPAAILAVERAINLDKTVFVVASKSGSTLETTMMQRYFYVKYDAAKAGAHFIAITDPGSRLADEARALNFRHILLNPEDIGGRYSALSYFGMAPAALVGLDFERIIDAGAQMQTANGASVMGNNHPGLWLGTVMGVLAGRGCDKLTLFANQEIAAFGDWAEQLIAESTGKDGKGIIPITGATIGMPHDYGDDRLFVYMRLDHARDNLDDGVRVLQEAGHPVVILELRDRFEIGAEFYRWMFATAFAGMILGVNPFDEPNVAESKAITNRLLDQYVREGSLPRYMPILTEGDVSLYADEEMGKLLAELRGQHDYEATALEGLIAAFLGLARSGEYIAFQAYLQPRAEHAELLGYIRRRARHTFRRAIMLGFGPRYLHSTGQLHKGGPNNGIFVQLTADDPEDVPIPGIPYSFSILKQAQAMGDYQALLAKGRRVLRIHFAKDPLRGLQKVTRAIEAAAEKRR